MNLATRILGVAIFVSVLAGATYGAFQAFGEEPTAPPSVELQEPRRVPTLLAGQPSPIALTVENTGTVPANVSLATSTDGFDLNTRPSAQAVEPGNSTQIRGLLSAGEDLDGEYTVTLVASDNATGNELSSVDVNVTVTPPSPPDIELQTVLPAVLPGEDATLKATLTNTVQATQRVNVTTPGPGSVEPSQVALRADGSQTVTVTVPVAEDASGRIQAQVVAENEVGQTSQASKSLRVVGDGELLVRPLDSTVTVEPGNQYTVPVVAVSNTDASGNVTANGTAVVEASFEPIEPRSATGGFVTLEVPGDASGTLEHKVDVSVAGNGRTFTVDVSTDLSGESPEQGKQATLEYVARLPDGGVHQTSIAGVASGPFAKADSFQGANQISPLQVTIGGQRQSAPSGVVDAARNLTVDESVTVTLSPEDAFGPERRTQELSATTEIPRDQPVERLLEDLPKQRLPPAFDIENKTVGDVIDFETSAGDETIVLQFEVVEKNEQTVTLKRLAEEGDQITFYPPWPNATEVTSVNETHIVYTTFPPEDATEEPFTWDANPNSHKAKWGNSTLVNEQKSNETTIVLQHDPEIGLEYQAGGGFRSPERTFRVDNVTSETVTVSTPNQHPLAGQTVIYDLTLTEISEPQRRGLPSGFGG